MKTHTHTENENKYANGIKIKDIETEILSTVDGLMAFFSSIDIFHRRRGKD